MLLLSVLRKKWFAGWIPIDCNCKWMLPDSEHYFWRRLSLFHELSHSVTSFYIAQCFLACCFLYWLRRCFKHSCGYFVTWRSILYRKWLEKINIPKWCLRALFSWGWRVTSQGWRISFMKWPAVNMSEGHWHQVAGTVLILISFTLETWHKLTDTSSLHKAESSVSTLLMRLPELHSLLCCHDS